MMLTEGAVPKQLDRRVHKAQKTAPLTNDGENMDFTVSPTRVAQMPIKTATFVINLEHRTDRRSAMERELQRVGWRAEFFPAFRPTDAAGFPSIGARGCFLSHLAVLRKARELDVQRLIILEDDLDFAADFSERWQPALDVLDTHPWSLFYPGHILNDLSVGLSLLPSSIGVQCTHFMMVNGIAIPHFIEGLETILLRPPGHPMGGPMHVDGAYSTIRAQNPALLTYAYSPALGYQRPSRTDIGDLKWFDRISALRPIVGIVRGKRATRLRGGA